MSDSGDKGGAQAEGEGDGRRPNWRQMFSSGLAGLIGVQSRKNRERDFTHGDVKKFVVMGVVLTLLFLFGLIGIVKLVLSRLA